MHIAIEITGITPLMLNRFTDEAADKATNGTRTASAAADRGTPHEIAEAALYVGLNGKPMIPQPNLLRCPCRWRAVSQGWKGANHNAEGVVALRLPRC